MRYPGKARAGADTDAEVREKHFLLSLIPNKPHDFPEKLDVLLMAMKYFISLAGFLCN